MKNILLVGCYTQKPDDAGIYVFELDSESGQFTLLDTFCAGENPSYLAVRGCCVYAVNEMPNKGRITTLELSDQHTLSMLTQMEIPGAGSCHLSLQSHGTFLFAANYLSGDAVSYRIGDGGKPTKRCGHILHGANSHCHCIIPTPDEQGVVVADLGTDAIYLYRVDKKSGALLQEPASPPIQLGSGQGPRHFVFHPSGKFGYLVTEMGCQVVAFSYDSEKFALKPFQTVNLLPKEYSGNSYAAGICITTDGQRLYVSNRGYDQFSVFRVEPLTGSLECTGIYPSFGSWPRSFCLSPNEDFLVTANQKSNSLISFRLDVQNGAFSEPLDRVTIPNPACVVFCKE